MKATIGILIVCINAACGLFFGGGSGPEWNGLSVTWGPNPFSKDYFVKQPLTIEDAQKQGFEQISSGCEGKFLGQRFIKDKDIGLVLIYDNKGQIAGAQMAIPVSLISGDSYKFSKQKMFNRDTVAGIDAYVLTAYYVDPQSICGSNDSDSRRVKGVVGTGLWFQNGTDPIRDSVAVPMKQDDAINTKWVQGACFPSMGVHFWYDNRLDSDCSTYFPAFLMYNKGTLTGYGWANMGKFEYTKRTEFPPLSAITSFLKPVPTCMPEKFKEVGGFTTMHIYFNTSPFNLIC